jgi:hypothetical protein
MERIALTLALAVAGGFIGLKLKIPAGALLGSMIAVGTAGVLGVKSEMPHSFNTIAQMILGGFLGLTINKDVIEGIKSFILPSFLVVLLLAIFGVLTGYIVSKLTGIEVYTSLFGSVPGGMQEMIVLSESYDVNHPAVVVIQTVRRVLIVVIYPILITLFAKLTNSVFHLTNR